MFTVTLRLSHHQIQSCSCLCFPCLAPTQQKCMLNRFTLQTVHSMFNVPVHLIAAVNLSPVMSHGRLSYVQCCTMLGSAIMTSTHPHAVLHDMKPPHQLCTSASGFLYSKRKIKPLPTTASRCRQSGDSPQDLTGADTLIGVTCVMRLPSALSYTYTSPVELPCNMANWCCQQQLPRLSPAARLY